MALNLSDLQLGDIASVDSYEDVSAVERQRFFAYGIVPGVLLSVVGIVPWSDWMQVCVDGVITLSIRKSEGGNVRVTRAC